VHKYEDINLASWYPAHTLGLPPKGTNAYWGIPSSNLFGLKLIGSLKYSSL